MTPVTKAVLWILVVFLAGTLFGGGMTTLLMPPDRGEAAATVDNDRPRERGGDRERRERPSMLDRLAEAVSLDAGQLEAVRQILREGGERYKEIETTIDAEKRKLRSEVRHQNRDRIRALLRPEQLTRFEAFLDQLHEEWEQRQRRQNQERGEGEGR